MGSDSEEGKNKAIRTTKSLTKNKREENSLSLLDSVVATLRGFIGTGILALPSAFHKAGYVVGTATILLLGVVAIHCIQLIVTSAHVVSKRLGMEAVEYGQLSELTVLSLRYKSLNLGCCHIRAATLGKIFKLAVYWFILLTQLGLVMVYIVFVATCLHHIVVTTPYIEYDLDLRIWIAIVLVPITLLVCIRDLRVLGPTIGVALCCTCFAMAVVLFDSVYRLANGHAAIDCDMALLNTTPHQQQLPSPVSCGVEKWPTSMKDYFIFFGIIIFSFEGITVVLPIENKLAKPQHFQKVLWPTLLTVLFALLSFPLLAYLAYGRCSNPNIMMDLSSENVWLQALYLIVVLYVAFGIYIATAVQFYPAADLVEPQVLLKLNLLDTEGSKKKGCLKWLTQIGIRILFISTAGGLSLVSPQQLGDYISLVGSVAMVSLGFVFPPLIHLLVFACADEPVRDRIVDLKALGTVEDNMKGNHSTSNSSTGKTRRGTSDLGDRLKGLLRSGYTVLWVTKDVVIMVGGLVAGGIAAYSALEELVTHFEEESPSTECVKLL